MLRPEKTRLLRFGWFSVEDRKKRVEGKPETFDFLGLTCACANFSKTLEAIKSVNVTTDHSQTGSHQSEQ
jgi:nucleoid DNA-binding protein